MKTGDVVTIKPEWRNSSEGNERYEVVGGPYQDLHGKLARVDISPVEWKWDIRPVETVSVQSVAPV